MNVCKAGCGKPVPERKGPARLFCSSLCKNRHWRTTSGSPSARNAIPKPAAELPLLSMLPKWMGGA